MPLTIVESKPLTITPSTTPATESSWYTPIVDFVSQLQSLNPVAVAKGVGQIVTDLPGTISAIGQENARLFGEAEDAFKKGDYATGTRKILSYIANGVPGMGSQLDRSATSMQEGRMAEGLGQVADLGIGLAGPALLKRAPDIRVPPVLKPRLNPLEQAAVEFGQAEGIPVDAATASGNRFVRGAQNIAERTTLTGAAARQTSAAAEAGAMKAAALKLADRTGVGPTTPEAAGMATRDALQARANSMHQVANRAYEKLRQIEADPANVQSVPILDPATGAHVPTPMALPVDLRAAKAALQPVYDQLSRQWPLTQRQASPHYQALKNLIEGDDFAPLSQADRDLGMLKDLARKEGGLVKRAVAEVESAVQSTVNGAGADAVAALREGRAATKVKYRALDTLDSIRSEPVQAFNDATMAHDAGVERLRSIARDAPNETSKLGRAYLDDLVRQASAEGGFGRGQFLQSSWQKLGPETKKILFKDPAYISDLDKFFLLMKRMSENPNPSGSAYIGIGAAHGVNGLVFHNLYTSALMELSGYTTSRLLRSPAGVRALTRGLTLPAKSAAAPALAAELSRLAGDAWQVREVGQQQPSEITLTLPVRR